MSTYLITGKLGSGKTLSTIDKIKQALAKGQRVATNLDINLSALMPPWSRQSIVRLPDFPTAEDMLALGYGSDTPDESTFGTIVLDEVAVWLNARNWNDAGRKDFIDWLLHSRKYGWHVYLIIQHQGLLDKQIRASVVEFLVECRRLDRLQVPFVGAIFKLFDAKLTLPKLHYGLVRYGTGQYAPIAERWMYRGDNYYDAYDTRQIFTADYPNGLHCLLPAWHSTGRYLTWWKMYKKVLLGGLIGGLVIGLIVGILGQRFYAARTAAPVTPAAVSKSSGLFSSLSVSGFYFDQGGNAYVRLSDGSTVTTTNYTKTADGYRFFINGATLELKK